MHNNAIKSVSLNKLISVTGFLFLIYFSCYSFNADINFTELVNIICPIILIFACLWTGFKLVQKSPLMIWSPMPWFLYVCALYFGFGPLVYHFGTPESIWYMDQYYPVDEISLLRTNMLNTVGISVTILGFLGSNIFLSKNTATTSQNLRETNVKLTKRLLVFLLVIGVPVKYLLALPHHFGLLNWVLPGSIQYFSIFTSLSIIILFYLIGKGEHQYRLLLYILITSELIVGLMTLAKIEVIKTFLMIVLGMFFSKPRMPILIFGSIIVLVLYAFLSPFVTYARLSVSVTGIDSIDKLSNSIQQYSQADKDEIAALVTPGVQGWWIRLAYANAQSFAMDAYDDGIPGDTFSKAIYVVVPRILFPNKPLISTVGGEFNKMVVGIEESYSGPGVFAEAYWNGGWLLLIVTCLFIGLLFKLFTMFSIQYIGNGYLAFLPCAFAGVMMGLRPDAWFVIEYIGPIVQIIAVFTILYLFGFFQKQFALNST